MMQATDFGNVDGPAELRPLDWPCVGCIFVEREMGSRPVIVREVSSQHSAQVPLAQDDDMVQTLAPYRADEPFDEGALPLAVAGREDFLDSHALQPVPARMGEDRVAIASEIRARGL